MAGDPRPGALPADVRLGDVRRRRQHPRHDRADHRPDRPRDLLVPVGHLTCVGHTREELEAILDAYAEAGVANVLALRGDPEEGPRAEWTPTEGGLTYASELVELARARGDFASASPPSPAATRRADSLDQDAEVLRGQAATPARSSRSPTWCSGPSDYFGLRRAGRRGRGRHPDPPGHHADPEPRARSPGWASCPGTRCPTRSSSGCAPHEGDPAGRPRRGHRDGRRAVRGAAGRRRARAALLHAQPLQGDARDLRRPPHHASDAAVRAAERLATVAHGLAPSPSPATAGHRGARHGRGAGRRRRAARPGWPRRCRRDVGRRRPRGRGRGPAGRAPAHRVDRPQRVAGARPRGPAARASRPGTRCAITLHRPRRRRARCSTRWPRAVGDAPRGSTASRSRSRDTAARAREAAARRRTTTPGPTPRTSRALAGRGAWGRCVSLVEDDGPTAGGRCRRGRRWTADVRCRLEPGETLGHDRHRHLAAGLSQADRRSHAGPIACATSAAPRARRTAAPSRGSRAPRRRTRPRPGWWDRAARIVARPCHSTPSGEPPHALDQVARRAVHPATTWSRTSIPCRARAIEDVLGEPAAAQHGPRGAPRRGPGRRCGARASGRRAARARAAGRAGRRHRAPTWHDDRRDRGHGALDVRRQGRQPARVDRADHQVGVELAGRGWRPPTARPRAGPRVEGGRCRSAR